MCSAFSMDLAWLGLVLNYKKISASYLNSPLFLFIAQELRGVSARELEALRRELEEEASRQRLHFLEEAELLKCKSEEQLQQRIAQLKVRGVGVSFRVAMSYATISR